MSTGSVVAAMPLVAIAAVVALALGRVRRSAARHAVRRRCQPARDGRVRPNGLAGRLAGRTAARWRRRASRDSTATQLAVLLDDVARRCASGHSLTAAFLTSSTAHPDPAELETIAAAVHHLRLGRGFDDALRTATESGAGTGVESDVDADVALAVHVLRLCAVQGGNIVESLDRAAATLRERQAVHDERLAQSGQARLSAKVLTVLPIAFASWTVLTAPSVQRFMASAPGVACVVLGVGLNLLGWTLMQRAIAGGR